MDRPRRLIRRISQTHDPDAHHHWPRPFAIRHHRRTSDANKGDPAPYTSQQQLPDKEKTDASARRLKVKRVHVPLRDEDAASDRDSEYSRPMKALEDADAAAQSAKAAAAAAAAAAAGPTAGNKLASASAVDLRPSESSLVPDFLPVQPIQPIPDPTAPSFRSKYNLFNPIGPRWYTNNHLTPPHTRIPLASTFSPSFPPIHSATIAGSPMDVGLMPGPSRTPSGSPQPTPNASQTRLGADGSPTNAGVGAGAGRSRKISQQNADLLDGSDPLGVNWHHPSSYDVLNSASPVQDVRLSFVSLCVSAL